MRALSSAACAIWILAAEPLRAEVPAPPIVLSEVHYHPSPSQKESSEFLEIHNRSGGEVDLSGWRFTRGIDFVFPAGARIPAGGYLVLVSDATAFQAAFGPDVRPAGVYTGVLANSGETIRLKSAGPDDTVQAEVTYDDLSPWPVAADGTGKSLELFDVASDGSDPFFWRAGGPTPGAASSSAGGSPGVQLAYARHEPVQPRSSDSVTVGVYVHHSRPLDGAVVKFRTGTGESGEPLSAALRDDGEGGDKVAGDGVHSARLPPQPDHTLVRYWFEVEDADGQTARLPDPSSPTSNFAYHVREGDAEGGSPVHFLIMDPTQWNQLLADTSDQLRPATLVHEGRVYDRISIRQRGAYARSWPKKSFKLFFHRDNLFLGQDRIDWNSGWRDPAFLRELIAHDLHRRAGALHSKVRVVRIHVNGAFHGSYLEVEHPSEEYLERLGLPGAILYKADSPSNSSDERRLARAADYAVHYEKETFKEEPFDDLHEFCSALATAAPGNANLEGLTSRVDIGSFINYLVANQFTSNWDAFNKNHYIARDREGSGKWIMAPWDLDRTLGDHWGGAFTTFNLHILLGEAEHPGITGWNRLFDRFYEHPDLRDRFFQRLMRFLLVELDQEELFEWIDGIAGAAARDIDDDRAKWNSDRTGMAWRASLEAVKKYVTDRRGFLLDSIPLPLPGKPSIVSPVSDAEAEGTPVTIVASEFVPSERGAAHHATRWQLRLDRGNWGTPILDVETRERLVTIELDVLPRKRYFVRVAYRDANGKLSPFSDEVPFLTRRLGLETAPVDLSGAFDADVIAGPGDAENDSFEGDATHLIVSGHDGSGSVNPSADGLPLDGELGPYRLAGHAGLNALQLQRGDTEPIEISVPAGSYAAVGFAVSGGAGDSQIEVEMRYATEPPDRGLILCDDWKDDENDEGAGGRLRPDLGTLLRGMDALTGGILDDSNEYALHEHVLPVDPGRSLERIVLFPAQAGGIGGTRFSSQATRFHLFAMTAFASPDVSPDRFRRGDADASGQLNIADAVAILLHLFGGKPSLPGCPDSSDVDDGGFIDLGDAVVLLRYLFLAGSAPPAPGPAECGPDPTADTLGACAAPRACSIP